MYVAMCQHDTDKYGEPTLEQVPCPNDLDEAKASPYWLSWKAATHAEIYENLKVGVGLIPTTKLEAIGHKLLGT